LIGKGPLEIVQLPVGNVFECAYVRLNVGDIVMLRAEKFGIWGNNYQP
jgi:hypothetical protein